MWMRRRYTLFVCVCLSVSLYIVNTHTLLVSNSLPPFSDLHRTDGRTARADRHSLKNTYTETEILGTAACNACMRLRRSE